MVDKFASRSLKTYREKSEKRKLKEIAEDDALIEKLIKSPKYFYFYQSRLESSTIISFLTLILGSLLLLSVNPGPGIHWTQIFFLAGSILIVAMGVRLRRLIEKKTKIIYRIIDRELEEKESQ